MRGIIEELWEMTEEFSNIIIKPDCEETAIKDSEKFIHDLTEWINARKGLNNETL